MAHSPVAFGEPLFEVVWPLGKSVSRPVDLAPALPDLNGKTVCEFWGWVYRGDQIFPVINEALRRKYPDIRIISYDETGDSHENNITQKGYVAALPDLLRRYDCDAVICGVGA